MSYAESLTVDQMRVLVAIVDAGTFSGASRALQRSQSAISYQVGSLERQLGFALFVRTRRRPQLTPAGRATVGSAREILVAFDQLRQRARGFADGVEPTVRLAVDVLYPTPKLAEHLLAFRSEFPGVEIDLRLGVRDQLAPLLRDDAVDLAVLPDGDPFEARVCEQVELIEVAAVDHPLVTHTGAVSDAELSRHLHLMLADGAPAVDGSADRRWRLNDSTARRELLLAGVGWCRMPRHQIAADLEAGRLARIRTRRHRRRGLRVTLYVAHAKGRPLGPARQWWFDRL